MNPTLRDRITRHLDALPDERAYQVLDYIEFLESRYASKTAPSASLFQRFTEGVEDTLRAGRVSTAAISETMGLLNRAVGVLSGVAAAGKSVASDIVNVASRATGVGETATSPPEPPPAPPDVPEPAPAPRPAAPE
jgi:hypothetical protein